MTKKWDRVFNISMEKWMNLGDCRRYNTLDRMKSFLRKKGLEGGVFKFEEDYQTTSITISWRREQ